MRVLSQVLTRWFIVEFYAKKRESFAYPSILSTATYNQPSPMDKRLAKDIVNVSLCLVAEAHL